jgi:hypothetical protein
MKRVYKGIQASISAALLAGAQFSVLVAVVVSRLGERMLRGNSTYRNTATE